MMRLLPAALVAGFIGLVMGYPATAGAAPACPNKNTVIVQGEPLPRQGTVVCDDDETGGGGLLGNAPVVGNLPGLGGLL